MTTWQDLEERVRFIASTNWRAKFSSELVHGRQIDAYARLQNGQAIAIEVTEERNIGKLQEDINKLTHVRDVNYRSGYLITECFCVTAYEPTPAMYNVASSINISVMSIDAFVAKFLPYDAYKRARAQEPFGSAQDPVSGKRDEKKYIFVEMLTETGARRTAVDLKDALEGGQCIALTGEYGTGKSKCVEYLFDALSSTAWNNLRFPISVDLRKCWGLRDRNEIIRRHLTDLNLSEYADQFIKAFNEGLLILLIDGFDEMGAQVWTDNSAQLRAVRADALAGVRDLIANQKGAIIITGRDHYFDNREEMLSSLGLANKAAVSIIKTKEEFSPAELKEFLEQNDVEIEIPEWLPRKPLTCEFFVALKANIDDAKLNEALDAAQFWDLILDAVCEREAKTNQSLARLIRPADTHF
jgi:hypothetical protein